ncbi:MAG: cytochrome c [Phycisphaeraceae bacterium]
MKLSHPTSLIVLLVAGAVLLAVGMAPGCGSARRGTPVAEPVRLAEADLIEGRQIFATHCYQCHPGGEAGLAPAINNKPLPGWLMRLQVRQGLGAMPAFPEHEINDDELDHLIAYLNHLQSLDPPPLE